MRISFNWLKEYIDLEGVSPEELASKLTYAGVEVESIEKMAEGKGLVIGKIIECLPHPDSDHLHVLKVDEGIKDGVHQIVCGAPNARVGLKVIVAKEGAVLPEITIKKSAIRGVDSDGMCCSLLELGFDKKFLTDKQISGIEELSEDAPVGEEDVLSYLGYDDTILDISILPNRSDLYAMENVAKEVSALIGRPVKFPTFSAKKELQCDFDIKTKAEGCPFIGIRVAKGVKVGPSPKWLSAKLVNSGIRSINNVVDIGNYVMLLTGQPMNMYDLGKMGNYSLEVIDDYEGEFLAMDQKSYPLKKGDLLIVNDGEPSCLAGIMTSSYCAVDANSVDIAIEAATFSGSSLRHTSSRLGLSSDSSTRFTKGIDPSIYEKALELSCYLLETLCGAKTSRTFVSGTPNIKKKEIKSSCDYINKRLGTSFDKQTIIEVLRKDWIEIKEIDDDNFIAIPPTYRIDMEGEADLSEEVIRLLGYDEIKSKLPTVALSMQGRSEEQSKIMIMRRYLRDCGVNEALTYSLISSSQKDSFLFFETGEAYKIINPLTEERQYYRRSLLPSLLEVAKYNLAHQAEDFSFYEISESASMGMPSAKHLAVVLVGNEKIEGEMKKRPYDFYSLKGYFEGIASILGLNENRYRYERLADSSELHPGRSAKVLIGKKTVAILGELHPSYRAENGYNTQIAVMEIDLSSLFDLKTSQPKASIPPRYPSTRRDLALVVGQEVPYGDIKKEISKIDRLIKKVEIFDLYQGEHIAKGKKSVAIALTLLDEEKTLVDASVNIVIEKVVNALKIKFGAEIRKA